MTTQTYQFHGLSLALTAEEPVLAVLRARLRAFPSPEAVVRPDLQFEWIPVADLNHHVVRRPDGPSHAILDVGGGTVHHHGETDELFVEVGGWARMLCHATSGRVRVSYLESIADPLATLTYTMFTIPLHEMLKRRGMFMMHAAGLAEQGRGVLLAGASGAGKTTQALALMRGGLGFLGDDMMILSARNGVWKALAFPDDVDVTPQTLAFFPELTRCPARPTSAGRPKRPVDACTAFGVEPVWECTPRILVFPGTGRRESSELLPLDRGAALVQLTCNVFRTDATTSQGHLDALAGVVRQCACYQLTTGRDFDALPALIRRVLH